MLKNQAITILENKAINYRMNKQIGLLDKMTKQGREEGESAEIILDILKRQQKEIDLMARELYLYNALDCDYKEFKDIKCKIKNEPDKEICKECIKQYFQKKVEVNK